MRVITEERSQDNLEIPRVSSRAREYDAKCNRAKRSTGAKTYNSIDKHHSNMLQLLNIL